MGGRGWKGGGSRQFISIDVRSDDGTLTIVHPSSLSLSLSHDVRFSSLRAPIFVQCFISLSLFFSAIFFIGFPELSFFVRRNPRFATVSFAFFQPLIKTTTAFVRLITCPSCPLLPSVSSSVFRSKQEPLLAPPSTSNLETNHRNLFFSFLNVSFFLPILLTTQHTILMAGSLPEILGAWFATSIIPPVPNDWKQGQREMRVNWDY